MTIEKTITEKKFHEVLMRLLREKDYFQVTVHDSRGPDHVFIFLYRPTKNEFGVMAMPDLEDLFF